MKLSIITLLLLLSSCGFQKQNNSDKCKAFYKLVKTDWIEKESHLFGWKGDPEYWNLNRYGTKYVEKDCLKGLNKKDITKLFGNATKEFNAVNFSVWTYCMEKTDACFSQQTNGNREMVFIFKNNIIFDSYTNPIASYSNKP